MPDEAQRRDGGRRFRPLLGRPCCLGQNTKEERRTAMGLTAQWWQRCGTAWGHEGRMAGGFGRSMQPLARRSGAGFKRLRRDGGGELAGEVW